MSEREEVVPERGEVCQRERAVPGGTAKEHGSTVSMETGGVA